MNFFFQFIHTLKQKYMINDILVGKLYILMLSPVSLPDLRPHFWCPSMERKTALRDTVSLSNVFYSFTPFWLTQTQKFLQGLNYGCSEHVVQSISRCPTLCNHMDYSMPGFPVLHHLPEFAQIHVHWVSDSILTISSSVAHFLSL